MTAKKETEDLPNFLQYFSIKNTITNGEMEELISRQRNPQNVKKKKKLE